MPLSNTAILDWNAAPNYFSPFNAIFTIINVPSSSPDSGPVNVQILSLQCAVRYVFCISQAIISSSFNAEIVKAILTEYLNTNYENVIDEGAVVVCPPSTIRAFLLKLWPSWKSNIISHLICW